MIVLLFFAGDQWLERWVKREESAAKCAMPLTLNSFVFCVIMVLHFMIPLRHHIIPGNVFYTEEGHQKSIL